MIRNYTEYQESYHEIFPTLSQIGPAVYCVLPEPHLPGHKLYHEYLSQKVFHIPLVC